MFDPASLRGMESTLTVDVSAMTAAAAKAAMVRVATAARDRVLAGTPRPSGYRQIVDGAAGAPLTAVRPDGQIIFAWQYLGEVVRGVYMMMVRGAPKRSGRYVQGIEIFIDDVLATDEFLFGEAVPPPAASIRIVATVPYARRLEIGKREDGSKFAVQIPYHNVEAIMAAARSLYRDLAAISFSYVDLSDGYTLVRKSGHRRRRGRIVTDVRYPAIVITARQA